jgi:hypothetical protein
MAVLTKWWICSACGYKNKPHMLRFDPAQKATTWDGLACEQCGALATAPGAVDYTP